MAESNARTWLFVDEETETKQVRRHCQPHSGIRNPGSRRSLRAERTKPDTKTRMADDSPASRLQDTVPNSMQDHDFTRLLEVSQVFDQPDPSDDLALTRPCTMQYCTKYYASSVNRQPWSGGLLGSFRSNASRQTIVMPTLLVNKLGSSALLAFVLSSPDLPNHLRNESYLQMVLSDALRRLAEALANGEARQDMILIAAALLLCVACHQKNDDALCSHLEGVRSILVARRGHVQGSPDRNERAHVAFAIPSTKLGYTQLHQHGLTSIDYGTPRRWLFGNERNSLHYLIDALGIQVLLEFHDAARSGNELVGRIRHSSLRPLEQAIIAAQEMLGLATSPEGQPGPDSLRIRGGPEQLVLRVHRLLFQAEGENGLREIAERCPGALVWLAMSCGCRLLPGDCFWDFAWLLCKCLPLLGILNKPEIAAYLDFHFCRVEPLEQRRCQFWASAMHAFGPDYMDWTKAPFIRPV